MLDISLTNQYNIYSQHGEDGILSYIIDYVFTDKKKPRTYVHLTDTHKPTSPIRNLVKTHAFVTNVPMSFNDGLIPCTRDGVCNWLSTPAKHAVHAHVSVLSVDVCGVDFWLLKTYMDNCNEAQKPAVIVVRINYIIDPKRSICVPYAPPNRRSHIFTSNYYGASLTAYINLLTPHKYTFVGTTTYGLVGFFVQQTDGVEMARMDPVAYLDAFPNVAYARSMRWPQVEKNCWITVAA